MPCAQRKSSKAVKLQLPAGAEVCVKDAGTFVAGVRHIIPDLAAWRPEITVYPTGFDSCRSWAQFESVVAEFVKTGLVQSNQIAGHFSEYAGHKFECLAIACLKRGLKLAGETNMFLFHGVIFRKMLCAFYRKLNPALAECIEKWDKVETDMVLISPTFVAVVECKSRQKCADNAENATLLQAAADKAQTQLQKDAEIVRLLLQSFGKEISVPVVQLLILGQYKTEAGDFQELAVDPELLAGIEEKHQLKVISLDNLRNETKFQAWWGQVGVTPNSELFLDLATLFAGLLYCRVKDKNYTMETPAKADNCDCGMKIAASQEIVQADMKFLNKKRKCSDENSPMISYEEGRKSSNPNSNQAKPEDSSVNITIFHPHQMRVLRGPKHQYISGGPGTGKTLIMIEKIAELASCGEKVIVTGEAAANQSLRQLYQRLLVHQLAQTEMANIQFLECSQLDPEMEANVFLDEFGTSLYSQLLGEESGCNKLLEVFEAQIGREDKYLWLTDVDSTDAVAVIKKAPNPERWHEAFKAIHNSFLSFQFRSTKNIQTVARQFWHLTQLTCSTREKRIEHWRCGHELAGQPVRLYSLPVSGARRSAAFVCALVQELDHYGRSGCRGTAVLEPFTRYRVHARNRFPDRLSDSTVIDMSVKETVSLEFANVILLLTSAEHLYVSLRKFVEDKPALDFSLLGTTRAQCGLTIVTDFELYQNELESLAGLEVEKVALDESLMSQICPHYPLSYLQVALITCLENVLHIFGPTKISQSVSSTDVASLAEFQILWDQISGQLVQILTSCTADQTSVKVQIWTLLCDLWLEIMAICSSCGENGQVQNWYKNASTKSPWTWIAKSDVHLALKKDSQKEFLDQKFPNLTRAIKDLMGKWDSIAIRD